jgi:hypothetical protein
MRIDDEDEIKGRPRIRALAADEGLPFSDWFRTERFERPQRTNMTPEQRSQPARFGPRRTLVQRNVFEIWILPQVKEREPDPQRNSGDSQRARYCTAQPEEVRHSTPAQTSASVLFTSLSP